MEDVYQRLHQHLLAAIHAEAEDLQAQIVSEFVHRQPRQPVGFSENHPAGIGKAQVLSVAPGGLQTAAEKVVVNGLVPVPAQNANRDFRLAVEEAPGQKVHPAVEHLHHLAVPAELVYPVDFVVIDPELSRPKLPFLASAEAELSLFHQASALRVWMKCHASRHISFTLFSAVQCSSLRALVGFA